MNEEKLHFNPQDESPVVRPETKKRLQRRLTRELSDKEADALLKKYEAGSGDLPQLLPKSEVQETRNVIDRYQAYSRKIEHLKVDKARLREEPKSFPISDQNVPVAEHTARSRRHDQESNHLTDTPSEQKPVSDQSVSRKKHNLYDKSLQRKSKLTFDQPSAGKTAAVIRAAGTAVSRTVEPETKTDENVSVKAAEKTAEGSLKTAGSVRKRLKSTRVSDNRTASRNKGYSNTPSRQKLMFTEGSSGGRDSAAVHKEQQKQLIRKNYARGYRLAQKNGTGSPHGRTAPRPTLFNRIRNHVAAIPRKSKGALLSMGTCGLFFMIITSVMGAGGTVATTAEGAVSATTYLAEDEDILAAEDHYLDLERQLQVQIDNIEQDYPGYDEYEYQIDEISHNPYHLISFLTVMSGEFAYADVTNSIDGLFEKQYTLTVEEESETVTETRTIHGGESLGEVVTSGYCACELCCGKENADGITASGKKAKADHTIAVDADNPFVPMGTHVIMNDTEYVVEDTGTFDRFGVQFDVFYDNHEDAQNHGHKTWEATLGEDEEVEITETNDVSRLKVKVTNHNLDAVIRDLLTGEEIEEYDTYNACYGNKEYLFGTENLPGEGGYGGIKYEIPPEALEDAQFRAMITEAEKYLGMAYKWGGKKPSTGFDCSGFVCWVINHCGVGWDLGSKASYELVTLCTYVSPEEAKPGDLVFFERTFDRDGVTHVGLYAGENMMIHAGDPIQYTNLQYQYWQDHFLCFGRLPEP